MGAPGEKGPNGLPVSMAAGPVTFGAVQQLSLCTDLSGGDRRFILWVTSQGAPLSQEETRFPL